VPITAERMQYSMHPMQVPK